MKNHHTALAFIAPLLAITSCTEPAEKDPYCSGNLYGHLKLSTHVGMQYVEGDNLQQSYFFSEMEVSDICNKDAPMIDFEIILQNEDSAAVKIAWIEEKGNPNPPTEVVLEQFHDDPIYRETVSYNFQATTGHTPGELKLHMRFAFSHQGSPAADSAYFYSNMEQFNIEISTMKQGK